MKQGEPNEDDLKPRNYPDVLDPDQAADYLGIGRTALFELLREGAIPHRRLTPKVIRFGRDALKEWIDSSGVLAQPPAAPTAPAAVKSLFTTSSAPDPPARSRLDDTEIMSAPAPAAKARMGTAEKKREFIELVSSGISDTAALKQMGHRSGSRATVARWRGSDPEFEAAYEQINLQRDGFDE